MCDLLGEEWFSGVFLRNCGPDRPQILIMNSHSSHETLGLLERAKQENIHILALPPHTTHHLQPLDESVCGPLKRSYNNMACTQYMSKDPYRIVNKAAWLGLFNEAYEAGVTTRNITIGFRACGIFPLNANALSQDLFLPSTVTLTGSEKVPEEQQRTQEDNQLPPNSPETTAPESGTSCDRALEAISLPQKPLHQELHLPQETLPQEPQGAGPSESLIGNLEWYR